MKASEYVRQLQALIETEGDLRITRMSAAFDVMDAYPPKLKRMKILKGRERKPSYADIKDGFGEKVIAI